MHILHILSHVINLFHLITQLSMVSVVMVLAGNFWLAAPSLCLASEQGKTIAIAQDDDASDDWMFDKSTYTNDPKTGKRVDQYKHEKTPYRDPNAWFDSPTGDFLFYNDYWGGLYGFEPNYFAGFWPELYSQYYFGEDGSGYYPYDGDPNDEENGAE